MELTGDDVSVPPATESPAKPPSTSSSVAIQSSLGDKWDVPLAAEVSYRSEHMPTPNYAAEPQTKLDPAPPTFLEDSTNPLSPAYPHLAECIISHLPHNDRLALRGTCHALRHAVDATLVRVLAITPDGPLCPSGRVPPSTLACNKLWPHIRALDLSTLTHPMSSRNDAALAHLPPLTSLPGLRWVRTSAEKALPRYELPTVIRMVDLTYSNPSRGSAPWRIHARSFPPHAIKLVLHIRYHRRSDVMHAQLSPRFWAFPKSLRTAVLHVQAHPNSDKGVTPSRAPPDNGFERYARLMGLARVLTAANLSRVVLVGCEDWEPAWCFGHRESGFQAAWVDVCAEEMMARDLSHEMARKKAENVFEFPSGEAYRAEVGEHAWRVETAGTLAELEDGEV